MAPSIAAAPASRRTARGSADRASGLLRPLIGVASLARAAFELVWRRRRLRVALLAFVILAALLAGGWLWLRHSPFVAVQRVQITGVHGPDAQAVEAALTQAAHGMSTLDVSGGALRAAVAPLHLVRDVRAIPSFPHGLRIEVIEQLPVATLSASGTRTAVAADGVVLGPTLVSSSLANVSSSRAPAVGHRVAGPRLLADLAVLGAAPAALARHVERVFTGAKGLTVAMRNGLLVYFGDDARPHAKWLALALVLADTSSAGASYIDVRVPSHPAAGFPAGVTPPEASAAATSASNEAGAGSESTVASLAASLAAGSAPSSASSSAPSSSPEPAVGEADTPAEPAQAEAPQTAATPGG